MTYLNEVIALTPEHGITRADCHAAFIAAGHDARTADQFAFGFARKSDAPLHPQAIALKVAMLNEDRDEIARLWDGE